MISRRHGFNWRTPNRIGALLLTLGALLVSGCKTVEVGVQYEPPEPETAKLPDLTISWLHTLPADPQVGTSGFDVRLIVANRGEAPAAWPTTTRVALTERASTPGAGEAAVLELRTEPLDAGGAALLSGRLELQHPLACRPHLLIAEADARNSLRQVSRDNDTAQLEFTPGGCA